MKWIIDRIENDVAVCETENGKTIDIPVFALPEDIKENDVIFVTADKDETKRRKEKTDSLMNSLFKD